MNQQFIDRIDALPDVFMLASLVQFKYVQTISEPNERNFVVGLAGGHTVLAHQANMTSLWTSTSLGWRCEEAISAIEAYYSQETIKRYYSGFTMP